MAKNIEIGGRLHSVATEHIVAGANEIQDDTLNKTQAQINEGVNNTLGIHDSAIEGLNSQNYVSVEAYSELPELGSVNTVYRVGSWDGEQVDTTKYAEYAWRNTGIDQGEYILLDVKNYGIDDKPTVNSDNLVKSGGVAKELTLAESVTKDYAGVITQTTNIIEPLIIGKEIYYKFSVDYHTIGCIGFFDTSDNIIGNWIGEVSSTDPANSYEGTVVVPEGAAYLKAFTGNNMSFTIDHLYYTDSFNAQIKTINYKLSKSLKTTSDNNSNNVVFSVAEETNNYNVRDTNANRLIVNTSETIVTQNTLRSLATNLTLKKGKYIVQCNFANQKDTDVYTVVFSSSNVAVVPNVIFNIEDGIFQSKEINIPSDYYGNVEVYTKANRGGLTIDFILISNELLLDKIDYTESLNKNYGKTISATEVLGINLMPGKSLYYKFQQPANVIAVLGFFDSSNTLIGSYIGQPASSQPAHLYEGTTTIPDNAVYLKAVTSGNGFTIDALYYTDSICKDIDELNKNVDAIEEQLDNLKDKEGAYTDYGQTVNSTSVLINPVKVGKTLFYEFIRPASTVACIGFFDSSDNLIGSYIGNTSTSGNTTVGYRGKVVVPQNAVYLKTVTSGNGFVIDHLYYTDSLVSEVDINSKKLVPYISLVASEGSTHAINSVLFTTDDVNIGQEISYSVRNIDNKSSYIALYDTNNTRLAYYGIGAGGSTKTVSGTFLIPNGFSYAVVNGNSPLIIFYLRYRISNNPTNNEINLINSKLWRNNAWLDNRLANPLHTSREKFNEDNPSTPIADETAMSPRTGVHELRIPVSIVTNSKTVLVAATASADGPVEHGETSIDVARQADGSNDWDVTRVFEYGSTYGQFWNLSLVIDRTGAHGTTGRIYIFSACGKGNGGAIVPAAQITYENADLLYSYSDDDGVTWSSPTSLKSLWTAEQYDMVTPAPNAGIQLTDGTLVIPLFNLKDGSITSGIMYKKPNGNWTLSSSVPTDYTHGNECVAVEITSNVPTLFIRNETEKDYTISNPEYIQGVGMQIWEYSFANNNWTKINSDFVHSTPCQFSIIKCNINSNTIYLQSGLAGNKRPYRYYPTVWASLDGITWIRVYRIYNGGTVGYTSLGYYDGKLVVSYETNGNFIKFQDITNIEQLILDSVNNYINYDITIQDRMQMLFDKLNGLN